MKIPPHLRQHVSPYVPSATRLAVAEGKVPLDPSDLVFALFLLGHDKERAVATSARRRFSELPTDILLTALEDVTDPLILRTVALTHTDDEAALLMIAFHKNTDERTLSMIAASGSEGVVDAIAENGELLHEHPALIEVLKKNPAASRDSIGRAEAQLHREMEGKGEVRQVLPGAATHQGEKDESDEEKGLYERIREMNVAEKIKTALLGNKEARDILIKDNNQMVAATVLKNPRITEEELIRVANSREVSDRMLRVIAGNKKYIKNYSIKLGLVTNPKTPLLYSLKFINSLNARDIRGLAKSRNVPTAIASAARRIVEKKGAG